MRLKITTILALVGLLQIHGCIAHGTAPGEVTQDKEGMQTMRQLGLNMAFLIKYRVSIRAIKEGIITEDQLLDAFIRSANSETRPSVESWSDRWHMIIGTIDQMKLDLPDFQEDKQFIDSVLSVGKYAISHSPDYRNAYHPHYRIVERNIFEKEIKHLIENKK
jgi:hypothetical protein